jgi:hypothetical protein
MWTGHRETSVKGGSHELLKSEGMLCYDHEAWFTVDAELLGKVGYARWMLCEVGLEHCTTTYRCIRVNDRDREVRTRG